MKNPEVNHLDHRRTVVGQSVWCIAKLCTLSSVMMSSVPTCACVCVYTCVYTCEERLRLAHTARSRDRTRAGIISSPRATKFLPSPTDPIEQTTIRKHSLARRILRPPFILELYNEPPVVFPCRSSVHNERKKRIFQKSLSPHVYVCIHGDLWAEVYLTSSLYYLNVTIIPTDPIRYFE